MSLPLTQEERNAMLFQLEVEKMRDIYMQGLELAWSAWALKEEQAKFWLSTKQAAEILLCSKTDIQEMFGKGEILGTRLNKDNELSHLRLVASDVYKKHAEHLLILKAEAKAKQERHEKLLARAA